MSPARARTTQCQRRRALETSIIPSLPALPLVICPWVAMQPQLRSSQLLDASCCLLSEKMGEERWGREGVCTGHRCSRNSSAASGLKCNRERSLLRAIRGHHYGADDELPPTRAPAFNARDTPSPQHPFTAHTRSLSHGNEGRAAMQLSPRAAGSLQLPASEPRVNVKTVE